MHDLMKNVFHFFFHIEKGGYKLVALTVDTLTTTKRRARKTEWLYRRKSEIRLCDADISFYGSDEIDKMV